jgi:hypothetical protein
MRIRIASTVACSIISASLDALRARHVPIPVFG